MTTSPSLVEELKEAARAGDWERLDTLSNLLPTAPHPTDEVGLADYLFQLQSALIAARTTRADLMKSLHRLGAASQFNQH